MADWQKCKQIWDTVSRVPSGKVASYGQIADLAGLPGRARLVGRALQQAPADLNLPWHRILRSNGQIAFPADSDIANQQIERLSIEGVPVINHRVNLSHHRWQPRLDEFLSLQY